MWTEKRPPEPPLLRPQGGVNFTFTTQHRFLNIVDVALVGSIRPRAGKQEVILSVRKSHLTALMTALSGADRSSTVTSQWQPRSSKESSVVMPVSTEEEKLCPFIKKKKCTSAV